MYKVVWVWNLYASVEWRSHIQCNTSINLPYNYNTILQISIILGHGAASLGFFCNSLLNTGCNIVWCYLELNCSFQGILLVLVLRAIYENLFHGILRFHNHYQRMPWSIRVSLSTCFDANSPDRVDFLASFLITVGVCESFLKRFNNSTIFP